MKTCKHLLNTLNTSDTSEALKSEIHKFKQEVDYNTKGADIKARLTKMADMVKKKGN